MSDEQKIAELKAQLARLNRALDGQAAPTAREIASKQLAAARNPERLRQLETIAKFGIDPAGLAPGELREIKEYDASGRPTSRFIARDPDACWRSFKAEPRRARFLPPQGYQRGVSW
jgi:hypothetical protein